MVQLACEDSTRRSERKRSTVRSNGHNGGKSSIVGRKGQDKARETFWPPTAAEKVPGLTDLVYHRNLAS
ncbi:hypothetical protein RRG08_021831 [Elysia crispata]|uniref:Uncharacterized protein n=1 Tax=Elysia crispata TaxID=231223 RepID=A0AAE1DNX3_9GAST|nr:hypothetical protein RRG08_021831 [Elysia crispata]